MQRYYSEVDLLQKYTDENVANHFGTYLLTASSEDRLGFFRFIQHAESLLKFNERRNMVVGDFGCGAGHFGVEAGKRMYSGKVYFVDVSPAMLRLAKQNVEANRSPDVEYYFIQTRAEDIVDVLGKEVFDGIVGRYFVDLFEEPTDLFRTAWRLLKHGGKFIFNLSGHNTFDFSNDNCISLLQVEFYRRIIRAFVRRLPFILSKLTPAQIAYLTEKGHIVLATNYKVYLPRESFRPKFDKQKLLSFLLDARIPLDATAFIVLPEAISVGFKERFSLELGSLPVPGIWDIMGLLPEREKRKVVARVYSDAFPGNRLHTFMQLHDLMVSITKANY
jgi:SAM-dependent methyltransferase